MFRSTWQRWLKQRADRTVRVRDPKPGSRTARRPQVEMLEDRLAPAGIITVIPGVVGDGSLDFVLTSNFGTVLASDGGATETISVGAFESIAGSNNISVTATDSIVFSDLTASGNKINLQAATGQTVSFFAQGGSLTFNNAADAIITSGASIDINAGGASGGATLGGLATNNGTLNITANNVGLNGAVNTGIGDVFITPSTVSFPISVGGGDVAGSVLGLVDTELDRITTAGKVQIGFDITYTGTISVVGSVTQAGSGYSILSLYTFGNVANGGGKISGTNLIIDSNTGIAINTSVTNLQYRNPASGSVAIQNDAALTLTEFPTFSGFTGNFNSGTTTTISTVAGPIQFSANTMSVGTLTVTSGDSGSPGDNLTVDPGVIISTSGATADITLRAGDDLNLLPNSQINSGRAINLLAGFNDSGDLIGSVNLSGNLMTNAAAASTALTVTSLRDVTLGSELSFPTNNVVITSSQGGIIDGNDGVGETNNITALNINLTAHTGIGSGFNPMDPLEVTTNGTVTAVNSGLGATGDIRLVNLGGSFTVAGSNAGNGPFSATARGVGSVITVPAANINTGSSNAAVILTADDLVITGAINAGTGIVTLQPLTPTRAIDLGTNTPGLLGLTSGELGSVTAGILRVGNTSNTGNIAVTNPIVAPAGRYLNLSLATAGTITQETNDTIRGAIGLALQGGNGVTLSQNTNDVTTLAGTVLNAGRNFTYFDASDVTIGAVDGVNGIRTNFASIDVETFPPAGTGAINVSNTLALNDIDSTGGPVSLIARGTGVLYTQNAGAVVRSGGGNLLIQADNVAIGAAAGINSGNGRTTLQPATAGSTIDLGAAGTGVMVLDTAELNTINAGTLQIGNLTSGSITVVGTASPTGIQVLSLQTAGTITESAAPGASLVVPNLAIRAANAVNLTQVVITNNVTTGSLAAQVTTGGQGFSFTDTNALTIGTVDGLSGVNTNNAPITLTAANGNLTLNGNVTAGLGQIDLAARGANSLLTNNATVSNSGANAINLTGDRMAVAVGTVTNALGGNGRITVAPFTAGRQIALGSDVDTNAGFLELSTTEVGSLFTSGVLQIGNATAGAILITNFIAVGSNTLSLITNGTVNGSFGSLQATNLRVTSTGSVLLPTTNVIGTVAINTTQAGAFVDFRNLGALTVGNVDSISGITTNNGNILVTATDGNLTIINNIVAGSGAILLGAIGSNYLLAVNPLQVSGGSVSMFADRIAIGTGLTVINANAGSGIVVIAQDTDGRAIELGTIGDASASSLNISDAEIDRISAGTIRIGDVLAGNLTITNVISAPNAATVFNLSSGGTITESGAGRLVVSGVALQGALGVDLTLNASTVNNLSGRTTGVGADFKYTNTGDLFVSTVDGVAGIVLTDGDVDLKVNAAGGLIQNTQPINTGTNSTGTVTLTADDLDLQNAITSTLGSITLKPTTLSRPISTGANIFGAMNLTDAELDRMNTLLLRIGDIADTGTINLSYPLSQPVAPGYNTLSLITSGAIVDAMALNGPPEFSLIQVDNLALTAGTGIGSSDDINLTVRNLAVNNATSGAIRLFNQLFNVGDAPATAALTISVTAIDGVVGVTNVGANPITINGANSVTIDPTAVVQSGNAAAGGTITIQSNFGSPATNADVVFGNSSSVLTQGDIVISADPNNDGIGGSIVFGTNVTLAGPGATLPDNVTLTSAGSIALPGLMSAVSINVNVTGPNNSIRDDGDDTTFLSAPTINLMSQADIGGSASITIADVISAVPPPLIPTPTAAFLGAIDIDLSVNPTLNVTQNGNVQLHGMNAATFNTSQIGALVPGGTGSQMALIADADLVVDAALTLPAANNSNLLLGAVNGNVTLDAMVTNAGTGPTAVVSAAGAVNFFGGSIDAGTSSVTIRAHGGSIVDLNGGATSPDVTGGAVNLQADVGGLELDVITTALTATTTNAFITVRGAANTDLPVSSVFAGTGPVSLSATNGNITDLNSNNLVADITGGTVSLSTTGTGLIGAANAFIEVDATTLNASTANQNLWIVDTVGGVAIGAVNAGSATARLQANAGPMVSQAPGGSAEVTANSVSLTGTNGGSFGSSAVAPLDIDAATLTATTAATGAIRVRDTSGGLNVTLAQTINAPVQIVSDGAGAGLVLTRVVAGNGNTATLSTTGTINGNAGGFADVTAGSLSATGATGIGSPLIPLETTVGTLAASGGSGGVSIVNSGALTIGTVGTLSGITATSDVNLNVPESIPASANDSITIPAGASITTVGNISIQAGDALTQNLGSTIQANGAVTLTGGASDDGNGGTVSILGQVTGQAVSINGGSGTDVITVNPSFTNPTVVVNGQAGTDTVSITPRTGTAYTAFGGLPAPIGTPPPANLPGDTFNVNLGAVANPILNATFNAATGYAGTWSFTSGGGTISFSQFETLTPTTSLAVTLSNGVTTSTPGTTTTYTLVVSNAGPSTAQGATLALPLPAALQNATFTSVATGGATGNTASGSGSLNQTLVLPANSTVTYTITALINPAATGSLTSTATLTAPAISPDLSGNVKVVTDTDTLTPSANLGVTKALVGVAPKPGGTLTYTVTATNIGPSTAVNVTVTDVLPADTVVSSITQTAGPAFTLNAPAVGSGGTFTATIASLAPGASATFTLILKAFATPGTNVGNTVTVTSTTQDSVASNNSATAPAIITANTIPPQIVTGTGIDGGPNVRVFDTTGNVLLSFVAYEESFRGGVNVAQGDMNGDGFPEIITGSGVNGGPVIKVFDGATGEQLASFLAYEESFRGGVNVAAGDIDGDGIADIIAGAGNQGAPAIKVFSGSTILSGNGDPLIQSYFAYEESFRGGVNVAAGDVNGDGVVDVIAGSGFGGGPAVKVFSGATGQLLQSYFAYANTLRDGVRVASGDVNGDGFADVITGPGNGGAPNVRVFDGVTRAMTLNFFAFDPTIFTGADVAVVDADEDGRADVVVSAGPTQPPRVKVYNGVTGDLQTDFFAYDAEFTGGVFVG